MTYIAARPILDDIRKDVFFLLLGTAIGGFLGYTVSSEYHKARYENQIARIHKNIMEEDESKLKNLEYLIDFSKERSK